MKQDEWTEDKSVFPRGPNSILATGLTKAHISVSGKHRFL